MARNTKTLVCAITLAAVLFPAAARAACQIPAADSGVQLVNDINACLSSVSAGGLPSGATTGQFLGQGSAAPAWYSFGGDVTGSTSLPGSLTVTGVRGMAVRNVAPSSGQALEYNSTNGDLEWTTPAGGSGSLPSGTAGQFFGENASASAAVAFSLTGDVSNSTSTPGALTVNTVLGGKVPLSAQGTAGQFPIENASANNYAWTSLSGDASNSTSTPGSLTVTGLRGIPIKVGTPTNGYVLSYVSANNDYEWVAQTGGGSGNLPAGATTGQALFQASGGPAWVSLSGDISNSTSTAGSLTVNTVKGGQTPITTNGASAGYLLTYSTGGAQSWLLPTGDLSASATTPGQMKAIGLQGIPVRSGTPTANQVLTYSSTNSDWEAAAPGTVAGGSAGQFYMQGSSSPGWFTCSGDVTCSTSTSGQITVKTIGGLNPVVQGGSASLNSLTALQMVNTPNVNNPAANATVLGPNSNYDIYLTGNVTWTLGTGMPSGEFITFNVHQPSSGSYTFTLQPASGVTLKWTGGAIPAESTTVNSIDVYQCEYLGNISTFACGLTLANVH